MLWETHSSSFDFRHKGAYDSFSLRAIKTCLTSKGEFRNDEAKVVEVVVRIDSSVNAHYSVTRRHDDFLRLVIGFVSVEDLLGALSHD